MISIIYLFSKLVNVCPVWLFNKPGVQIPSPKQGPIQILSPIKSQKVRIRTWDVSNILREQMNYKCLSISTERLVVIYLRNVGIISNINTQYYFRYCNHTTDFI